MILEFSLGFGPRRFSLCPRRRQLYRYCTNDTKFALSWPLGSWGMCPRELEKIKAAIVFPIGQNAMAMYRFASDLL